MNEQQKAMLDQQTKLQRGAAIIEGTQEKFRQDGYTNMLNKYGTKQDNSIAYQYTQEMFTNDLELIRLYEGNGLFAKIIDRPSEEAVKHGLDVDFGDEDISEYIEDRMDDLEFEDKFATAEKWARLYGGSIIVMLVDDGRGLDEPLDWNNARSIEELRVFERAIVQPDYSSLYNFHFFDTMETDKPFAEPEYYQVFSLYGYFTVHRSRCLVFRNGRLPEQTTNAIYRYWGIPEYVKIKRALRECITSHEDGVKLLERSVQAIYKMKNLANMLSTADGEDKVLQRLQVIDMARGILNSIAIDNEGEDYDFKTLQMSGVKDVIDATCNMLSAVTNIPQTILFGRSPAGMNSTGEGDMENFYNMVENIQKQNMKKNARTVIDLMLKQGKLEGRIPEVPKYKVKFAPLWSLSDAEQAGVDQTKAQTEYTKAQTVQIYMDTSVIDPSEVRSTLAKEGDIEIEEMLSDTEENLDIPEDTFDVGETISISGIDVGKDAGDTQEIIRICGTAGEQDGTGGVIRIITPEDNEISDGADYLAAAVIIIKDGKILCASRRNSEGICGPGGKVEEGEEPEEAAVREAMEEFNIVPLNLLPIGEYKGSTGRYLPSKLYFTDKFSGTPEADGDEMLDARWLSVEELNREQLFPPFEESVKMLINLLTGVAPPDTINAEEYDGGAGSGNWGHSGRPGKIGGSGKGGGKANRTGSKESGFSSEAKKRAAEKKADKESGGNGKSSGSKAEKKSGGESKGKTSNSKPSTSNSPRSIGEVKHYEVDSEAKKQVKSLTGKYKRTAKQMDEYVNRQKMDDSIKENFSETTMTTKEFTERSINTTAKWSDEDKMLDSVYTGNTADIYKKVGERQYEHSLSEDYQLTDAESDYYMHYAGKLNAKLYSGMKLNEADMAVVEHFNRCAEPLGKDTDLYRMTGTDYLTSLLGQTSNNNFSDLKGKEITNKALLSTSPGVNSFFANSAVCIKIKTPGDVAVCMTRSVGDGEIVIPTNSRMRITSVQQVSNQAVPGWTSQKSNPAGFAGECGNSANDYARYGEPEFTHTGYYVEMELIGYED